MRSVKAATPAAAGARKSRTDKAACSDAERVSVRLRGARCLSEPIMLRDELWRELPAPAEDVAPRLVDNTQLLAVTGLHRELAFIRPVVCP